MSRWKKWINEVSGAEGKAEETKTKVSSVVALEEALLYMMAELGRNHALDLPEAQQEVWEFWKKVFDKLPPSNWQHKQSYISTSGAMPYLKMAGRQWVLLSSYDLRQHVLGFLFRLGSVGYDLKKADLRALQLMAAYMEILPGDYKLLEKQYMKAGSPYALLQIEPGCTRAELKKAYKQAVLRIHPDRNQAEGNLLQEKEEAFIRLRKAYEQLLGEVKG